MFDFNRMQDAFVKFLQKITPTTLRIGVDSKEVLDELEKLTQELRKDRAEITAAAVAALEQIKVTTRAVAIDITIETPSGGRYAVKGSVKSLPPGDGGGS